MTEQLEETAQQIADQGREALIARLRPAFQEAAAAHSDVLDLSPEQLDAMVERAVERADGLQWRRALASVATEQLGIGLGEALGHPAVVRAQELAGAPSYEESLAALGPLPSVTAQPAAETEAPAAEGEVPSTDDELLPSQAEAEAPPVEAETEIEAPVTEVDAELSAQPDAPADEIDTPPGTGAEDTDEDEELDELPAAEGDEALAGVEDVGTLAPAPAVPFADHDADTEYHEATEPDPDAEEGAVEPELPPSTAEYEAVGPYEDDEEYEDDDIDALRVAVIHLGGIANLAPAERNIELQMSEDGLDIVRGGGEILGRLDWEQVKALEVPAPRGRRRMRRGASTHLIVRTARGDASFEVPEVTPPELQEHLAPIVARHIRPD